MARILPTISVGIVLSVVLFANVPTPAADLAATVSRHVDIGKATQKALIVAQNSKASQRTCDWIGPGGRAIYRYR
jgi:hypothetical protein